MGIGASDIFQDDFASELPFLMDIYVRLQVLYVQLVWFAQDTLRGVPGPWAREGDAK